MDQNPAARTSQSSSNGAAPSSNGHGHDQRVTYAEVRRMARWLQVFTAQDLADSLRVPIEVGDRFVTALLWHGITEDTGEWVEGPDGVESVYEMVPLPPGPKEHPTGQRPEIAAVFEMFGGFELFNLRGVAVRIRTERQMRKSLSTPGARQKHKMRELAYERQQQANRRRLEEQAKRGPKEPKWERQKKTRGSGTVVVQD